MADDEKESSYNGGTVAGGLAGAAVGVALLSNPAGVLGMLGVASAPAPVVVTEGFMTVAAVAAAPVAAISAGTMAALSLGALALVAVGAYLGGKILQAMRHRSHPEARTEITMARSDAPSQDMSAEPQQVTGKQWAKTVETAKTSPELNIAQR